MIKGVNLGGWLVLEPWMTPHLFPAVEGYDETRLSREVSSEEYPKLMEDHYNSWIVKEDFSRIKEMGLNLVRIPFPWWLFGDHPPYTRSIEYLDKALDWADETGLDVMLDLHAAPGCQNGFDNGGICGVLQWHEKRENIDKTLDILLRVAERYVGRKSFHSLGVLNEPGWQIDIEIVQDFYREAEEKLRPLMGYKPLVFHDSFRPDLMRDFFKNQNFGPMIFDSHIYQCFMEEDRKMPLEDHLKQSMVWRREKLSELGQDIPVVVGEWSLALPPAIFEGLKSCEVYSATRSYADSQLIGMNRCNGWIFWSYKVADKNSPWNFKELYNKGIFNGSVI